MTTIDYGMGQTNIDKETGIRYGVIHQNEVIQVWSELSEPYYGTPHCPACGAEFSEDIDDGHECECGHVINWVGEECYGESPISWYVDNGKYLAECSGDDSDIFIRKSPYYTKCGFCSPCAPGAGYLLTRTSDCRAYCFGPGWFDGAKPPYPIWRVKDDVLVYKGPHETT